MIFGEQITIALLRKTMSVVAHSSAPCSARYLVSIWTNIRNRARLSHSLRYTANVAGLCCRYNSHSTVVSSSSFPSEIPWHNSAWRRPPIMAKAPVRSPLRSFKPKWPSSSSFSNESNHVLPVLGEYADMAVIAEYLSGVNNDFGRLHYNRFKSSRQAPSSGNSVEKSADESAEVQKGYNDDPWPRGKPTFDQLNAIAIRLSYTVPKFFYEHQEFSFYQPDVHWENRIWRHRGFTRTTLTYYFGTISLIMKFAVAHADMHVLQVSPLLDEGTVRIRFRASYVPHYKALQIWNVRVWDKESRAKNARWYDGYAILHVDGYGKVYKLVIDRAMQDDNKNPDVLNSKSKATDILKRTMQPAAACKATTAITSGNDWLELIETPAISNCASFVPPIGNCDRCQPAEP